MSPVLLDGERLTLSDVERVARHREAVALDPAARPKLEASRRVIEAALAAARPPPEPRRGAGRAHPRSGDPGHCPPPGKRPGQRIFGRPAGDRRLALRA